LAEVQSTIAQLQATTHTAKQKNALLREALSTSAQTLKVLMGKLKKSQTESHQQVRKTISIWQKN